MSYEPAPPKPAGLVQAGGSLAAALRNGTATIRASRGRYAWLARCCWIAAQCFAVFLPKSGSSMCSTASTIAVQSAWLRSLLAMGRIFVSSMSI